MPLPNPVRSIFGTPLREDSVIVNIGPSHPATHGTVQIIAELDGERVLRTDIHCGYLHRGFEKECEDHTWHNLIPYVDRLNYVSALVNDFAYCDAVEQLMVERGGVLRFLRVGHVLAQVVDGNRHPQVVDGARGAQHVVHLHAGDEASGHAASHGRALRHAAEHR